RGQGQQGPRGHRGVRRLDGAVRARSGRALTRLGHRCPRVRSGKTRPECCPGSAFAHTVGSVATFLTYRSSERTAGHRASHAHALPHAPSPALGNPLDVGPPPPWPHRPEPSQPKPGRGQPAQDTTRPIPPRAEAGPPPWRPTAARAALLGGSDAPARNQGRG